MAGDGRVTDVGAPVIHINAVAAVTCYACIGDDDTGIVADMYAVIGSNYVPIERAKDR